MAGLPFEHLVDEEQDVKDYIGRLRNIEPLMNDLIDQLKLRQDVKKIAPAFFIFFIYLCGLFIANSKCSGAI